MRGKVPIYALQDEINCPLCGRILPGSKSTPAVFCRARKQKLSCPDCELDYLAETVIPELKITAPYRYLTLC